MRGLGLIASTSVAVLLGAAMPAEAAVTVFGSTRAQECYEGAEFGRKDSGLKECNEALKEPMITKSDEAATLVNRGIIFNRLRQLDRALEDFQAAIAIDAELGEAYLNRGNTYFFQRNFDAALTDYSKAIDLDTTDPEVAYFNRALVYEVLKRYAEAKADLVKCLEIDPEFSPAKERMPIIDEAIAKGA